MHLTDEQLNEYLDRETDERAQIELHLSGCEDCSARLAALQELFSEIESLPELGLSPEFSVRLEPVSSHPTQLPRSLGLTLALQIALAAVAIVVSAPFEMQFLAPYASSFSAPSVVDISRQLQSQWAAWLDLLSNISSPALPEVPVVDVSSLFIMLTVLGVSLLWLIGNGLLLRSQVHKSSH
jgi:hypothetical protein